MKINPYIESSANISECGLYRYQLDRTWEEGPKRLCIFVMLNPSTADAEHDDPTLRKCIGIAKNLGCNSVRVINLFAFRTKSPVELAIEHSSGTDVFGPKNEVIQYAHTQPVPGRVFTIAAWGNHGNLFGADQKFLSICKNAETGILLHSMGFTLSHQPKHPLYLKSTAKPQIWRYQDH